MTTRTPWAVACAILVAALASAAAQERPPTPPAPSRPAAATLTADGDARPPERPDAAPEGPPAPADPFPARDGKPFGPPPPPTWFTLAETDAEFAACRLALSMLGSRYTVEPPVTDPDDRNCGIARPLRVTHVLADVALSGNPVMRCDTARALGLWTRDFLLPATALMPGAPRLAALETGPAYTCRDRVGTGAVDPKPSEHGFGNAIDVTGFRLAGAEPMPVAPRGGDGDSAESFQRAARATACLLFSTVLGPGSNAAHDDHLHLDVARRGGGWRLCE